MGDSGDLLMSSLQLIYRDEAASTVAACLLLKTLFLGLHLLALGLPECSGMERLALLHWSFDVLNVWCLAVFARTERLPWTLKTCVVYHVLGYLVYSLVYLHLHGRELATREGGLSRLSGTPDSEPTVRVSEEEGDVMGTAGEALITPSRAGVLSESSLRMFPEAISEDDEEPATEDREDAKRTTECLCLAGWCSLADTGGKKVLCSTPEDDPALTNGEPTPQEADGDQTEDQGGPTDDQGLEKDQGEPKWHISPVRASPPVSVRPVGTGEPQQKSPAAADEDQRRNTTGAAALVVVVRRPGQLRHWSFDDLAAILTVGRQRDSESVGRQSADDGTDRSWTHLVAEMTEPGPVLDELVPPEEGRESTASTASM